MNIKRGLAGLALALVSWAAQAEPYFFSKDGSMVWDKATGLVWMRCSLGQQWNRGACSGNVLNQEYRKADEAVAELNSTGGFGGVSDWKLPSARQLVSIRLCSNSEGAKMKDIQDGGSRVLESCRKDSSERVIDDVAFPDTPSDWFWTSSPSFSARNDVWLVNFSYGSVSSYGRNGGGAVRFVRATQTSEIEAASAFPMTEAEARAERTVRILAERKAREAAAETERNERAARAENERKEREARERKEVSDRAMALKRLVAMGARGLYLEAGKAQRSGAVTYVNTSFDAADLYELIVTKFPSSEYAVKATDQLTAMDRVETQSRAVRNAAEAQRQADQNASNRAQCFSQVRSCEANCANAWSRDYRMAQSCVSGCQRTCN